MIDETELKLWIARLETEESSWPNYEKLAALYIIRNEHGGQQMHVTWRVAALDDAGAVRIGQQ